MKLSVFPSSMETARSLIFHLVDIMNAEPDKTFNIAVSGGSTPALMFDLWANESHSRKHYGNRKRNRHQICQTAYSASAEK